MIVAISNQKGGVGKTTTVINLGMCLAELGKRVLIIDLDPQANSTSGLGANNQGQANIYDVLTEKKDLLEVIKDTDQENLKLAPSSIELAGAEVELVNTISRESVLKNSLKAINKDLDYILIDCPPSLGLLTINALVAADLVFIPVQCEYFALEGLSQLINTIKLVRNKLNPSLEVGGVILTMYDSRTNLSKQVAQEVKNFFTHKVFRTTIPRSIKLSEAPSYGKAISKYSPNSSGAEAYSKLAVEVVNKYNG